MTGHEYFQHLRPYKQFSKIEKKRLYFEEYADTRLEF